MNEVERQQRETAQTELQWHREEAQRHGQIAKNELQIAEYHLRQVSTWGEYLAGLGRVTLQAVPEPRDSIQDQLPFSDSTKVN